MGRPKNVENMEPWERKEHERKQAIKHLTPEQTKALREAGEALGEFVDEWTETFDLHNPETPRKLQSAFWSIKHLFPIK